MTLTPATPYGVTHSSGGSSDWGTPLWLYDMLDKEFNFVLDPCADEFNTKCEYYYTTEDDGLAQSWEVEPDEAVFVNPPFGPRGIWVEDWCHKAFIESLMGYTCVMLLAARTSNHWWHDYVMKAHEIRFVNGRIKFDGAQNVAGYPSVVVIFESGKVSRPVIGPSINARKHNKKK
jgi:phage N-6-adenine-methyltransferase